MTYIHEIKGWPEFTWNSTTLENILAKVKNKQELVRAYMQSFGLTKKSESMVELETLMLDVIKSTEIEGEKLDPEKVRSSLARRLGLDVAGLVPSPRNIDGVVEMMVDATQKYNMQLTKERLCGWQAALFPTGRNSIGKITVGRWRTGKEPMQVISGAMGREKVHYEAPEASALESEMQIFLEWFNTRNLTDPLLKAAIAHLWFVTIHPFEDGNGRIARAIADMQLSRADDDSKRFYSMSAQIETEKNRYYDILEKTQKGTLDITEWLEWFLNCLDRALSKTKITIDKVMEKARFWAKYNHIPVNSRQRGMINRLLDGFDGKLNSSKWAKIGKCSADTALRDIQDLINKRMLMKGTGGSKNTHYVLTPLPSSRKDMEYDLSNTDREVKFSIETPGSSIEIKKVILIPLFSWTKPDEWSSRLMKQGLYLKVSWQNAAGNKNIERVHHLDSLNDPYYFDPIFPVKTPIVIPVGFSGEAPNNEDYPINGTIELCGSTQDFDFDVTLVYDKVLQTEKINSMVKVEHKLIELRANVPYNLQVIGGIDYFNTLLYFRYNPLLRDKQIMIKLKNNAGEIYSTPVHFEEMGITSFFLVSELADRISDYIFHTMEFISKEDMFFEFWAEDQEGGFMGF